MCITSVNQWRWVIQIYAFLFFQTIVFWYNSPLKKYLSRLGKISHEWINENWDLQLYAAKRFSHIKYVGLIAPIPVPVVLLKRIARVCKRLNYMILLMRAVSCYTRWKNDGQYLLFFFLSALHIWSRILGSCCGLLFRGGSFITENCLGNYFEFISTLSCNHKIWKSCLNYGLDTHQTDSSFVHTELFFNSVFFT